MDDQSLKSLKITLGILLVVVLGTLVFVVLRGRNTVTSQVETVNVVPPAENEQSTVETATIVPPAENEQSTTDVVTPAVQPVSEQTLDDKAKELQGLIDAGKITSGEATKQMKEFIAKSQATPAEVKK